MSSLLLLMPLVFAADLSLMGRVVSIQRNPATDGFSVKFEGMSAPLLVQRGPNYKCLRQGLNTQEALIFSFDPKSLKIQSCESRS